MSSPLGRLVLCPDVTPGRGLGHLQRSLALGEAWQRAGGEAVLIAHTFDRADPASGHDAVGQSHETVTRSGGTEFVRERAESAGITVLDAVPDDADWIVLDGYEVSAENQAQARASARHVALIDDHATMGGHAADLVIDQNLGATSTPYGSDASRVLLGPRYALLREAFAVPPQSGIDGDLPPNSIAQVPSQGTSTIEFESPAPDLAVLVTLGGSPSEAAVAFVAETLALLDLPADAVATVGPLGTPTTKRGEPVPSLGHPSDLAATLAATRVALSAAGSTAWELCATGTPAVLVSIADNQVPVGVALADAGVADHLGPVEQADPQQAAEAIDALLSDDGLWTERREAGNRLVDGRGADRVVTAMRSLDIELRPATPDDAETLWRWANNPAVRASAFDPNLIPWGDHIAWLEARLADPGTTILVATDDGEPWGQVRFDALEDRPGAAEIDVSVAVRKRGQGLAGPLLAAAVTRAFDERCDLHVAVAQVKAENTASLRAFDRAAFIPVDVAADESDGVVTLHRERADG